MQDVARCPFSDPERLFEDLASARSSGEIPYSEAYQARVVTNYEDIVEALHDPARFSSRPTVPEVPSPWREMFEGRVPDRGTLLGHDNPDHDRLRSSVNTFFMPRKLARFAPWITTEAHRLVDNFEGDGHTDLKTSFALPLPLRVVCHVVGLGADRADWVGQSLSFFLGERDIHHGVGTPQDKAKRLIELHDALRGVMADRRADRKDDLISHIWNERDAGAVSMTDFEMLSMFPGLMLAGHETSSNLICMALSHLLSEPARYATAQRDDASRTAALEEMLRFESAITGMKRLVTRDTELGGTPLRAGEVVFLAYAEGSREPSRFQDPHNLDLSRSWSTPHLGFGQGIHACLGAPLARLLLGIELKVLHERLPDLRLAVPYADLRHTAVSEGRGIVSLPLAWTPVVSDAPHRGQRPAEAERPGFQVLVTSRRVVASDVVELTLTAVEGALPSWEPGAHIDVEMPSGAVRQYSLCGSPGSDTLRIAVRRDAAGRGGSIAIFDWVRPGHTLRVRGPRNHFFLREARSFVFVAGGIGITPMLPLIEQADAGGAQWRLVYLGRERARMAYVRDLLDRYPDRVEVWVSTETGSRHDLRSIFQALRGAAAYVYGCGPESLLAALEEAGRGEGRPESVIVERFAPLQVTHEPNRAFEVHLARSRQTLSVAADDSVLDAVNRAGANVLSTCREGTCGTCEVRVMEGIPEHRDSVLSLEERLENTTMMTCVSRCRGDQLTLDL